MLFVLQITLNDASIQRIFTSPTKSNPTNGTYYCNVNMHIAQCYLILALVSV